MPRAIRIAALLLAALAAPSSARAADPLIGVWEKDGAPYSEVRADHTATVGPDKVRWSAEGRILTLVYADGRKEEMEYAVDKRFLTVTMDGESETYTRAAPKAKPARPAKTAKAVQDELTKLLLSSAWCSFRYNKISGATHQERVVFRGDGRWNSGARGETYSSGAAGTVSGQSDSSSGGRWAVRGSSLLMSSGVQLLEDTGLSVSRNSKGYPILKTGNKEYSSCD